MNVWSQIEFIYIIIPTDRFRTLVFGEDTSLHITQVYILSYTGPCYGTVDKGLPNLFLLLHFLFLVCYYGLHLWRNNVINQSYLTKIVQTLGQAIILYEEYDSLLKCLL